MRIDAYTHFIPEKYFAKIVESGHADIGAKFPASMTSMSAARSSTAFRTTRRSCLIRCRRSR